jgi:D-serine deaminase-like pyridoxal phosphate-dependent protein
MTNDWYTINNADQVPSPALLLYPDRIQENLQRMIAAAGGTHRLRPHVKTHKLPQIIAMKLSAGITKFKVATIAEAEMTAAAGGRDVLLAYQQVGPNAQRFVELILKFPATKFSTLIDHSRPLAALDQAANRGGVNVSVFLDLDVGMQRTGIAPGDAALDLYRSIDAARGLTPAGLHAYDGHLHVADRNQRASHAKEAFAAVWELRDRIVAAGLTCPVIVASGTPTFPILAGYEGIEVGCGTTVLWDSGQPLKTPDLDFLNAAVLLTRVVSKPSPQRACLDLGHKAIAAEMPQPRGTILGFEGANLILQSEEHLVIESLRATELAPGDVLYVIPRHICPTVALHQEAHIVRAGRVTEQWPIVARNRRLTV